MFHFYVFTSKCKICKKVKYRSPPATISVAMLWPTCCLHNTYAVYGMCVCGGGGVAYLGTIDKTIIESMWNMRTYAGKCVLHVVRHKYHWPGSGSIF